MADEQKPYDAGDEGQVKDRKFKVRRVREQELKDLREVLATPAGRRVVWRWLSNANLFREVFSTNALQMAHLVGMRTHGNACLADVIEAGRDLYLTMQNEAFQQEEKSNA